MDNPLIEKVLSRYPDVDRASLAFPADAEFWDERDLDLFIGSGGFVKPKKKQAPGKAAAGSGSGGPPALPAAAAPAAGTSPPVVVSPSPATLAAAEPRREERAPVPSPSTGGAAHPVEGGVAPPLRPIELEAITVSGQGDGGGGGYTSVPITTHLEDMGPLGLRLSALLNKCERCRSLTMLKVSGHDLSVLRQRYNVGILLREFACEVAPVDAVPVMSVLRIHSHVELPVSPFLPFTQKVVREDGPEDSAALCSARFGLLLLNLEKMLPVEDNSLYERVVAEFRRSFSIPRTGDKSVPKFPKVYPRLRTPFRPSKVAAAQYTIRPSDCDMYRVLFHPRVPEICESVNFSIGAPFCERMPTAVYANLSQPVRTGDHFDVHLFVEEVEGDAVSPRTAVLYLFVHHPIGEGPPTASSACAMTVLMVYGTPPGRLSAEEIGACGAPHFAKLLRCATADDKGVSKPAAAAAADLDLSCCIRVNF